MRIAKYEFDSREQAQSKIDALGTATDEDGNEYPTHKSTIVQLGNIVLEQWEYDEEGEEVTAPVLSEGWHIDVCWNDADITNEDGEIDHPYGWKSYAIDIEGNGVHSFYGLNYDSHKM